jgi:PKD repeat protein
VDNQPPTANPGGPYTGEVGTAVSFDGTGSSDPDGTVASYAWDFGDGATGTGATPSHTYATAGSFTVSLTVTDDDGAASAPVTTTATITSVPDGADCNGDGISDEDSRELGLDPCDPDGDTDNDELSDVEETGGDPGNPQPIDSDNDGIIDALEPGEDALDASTASGLAVSNGVTASVTTAAGEALSEVSAADANNVPSAISFPFGIISYTTTSPIGGIVTVRTRFDAALPNELVLYKVDKQGIYRELPSSVWEKVDSRTVDVTLRDGDPHTDLDGEINGSIDDPVGVGGVIGSGSGGCTISTSARFDPIWLFLLVVPGVGYLRRRATALKAGDSR